MLSISRRSLYYQPVPPPPEEVAIKHRIDELYTAHPSYGSRKLTVPLQEDFRPINRKRVQRYMREMGIAGISPGPNLSKRATEHRIYPYLLRDITAQAPNHIWGSDITYIRLRGSWLYLVAILDWFSRYVVSWTLSDTLEMPFVLEAVALALGTATPQIWNTDQGSQFTSPQLTTQLEGAGVLISMEWQGPRARYHLHRALVALSQVRGGLSHQLRQPARSPSGDWPVFPVLQHRAAARAASFTGCGP